MTSNTEIFVWPIRCTLSAIKMYLPMFSPFLCSFLSNNCNSKEQFECSFLHKVSVKLLTQVVTRYNAYQLVSLISSTGAVPVTRAWTTSHVK